MCCHLASVPAQRFNHSLTKKAVQHVAKNSTWFFKLCDSLQLSTVLCKINHVYKSKTINIYKKRNEVKFSVWVFESALLLKQSHISSIYQHTQTVTIYYVYNWYQIGLYMKSLKYKPYLMLILSFQMSTTSSRGPSSGTENNIRLRNKRSSGGGGQDSPPPSPAASSDRGSKACCFCWCCCCSCSW